MKRDNSSKGTIQDLSLKDIKKLTESDSFKRKLKVFDKETIGFAANKKNYSRVVESAWTSLKKSDPVASYQQATKLARMMEKFAQVVLGKVRKPKEG